MYWLIYALGTALFESLKDVFGKKALSHIDEYVAAWAWSFFATPFLIAYAIYQGLPEIHSSFWWAFAVSSLANAFVLVIFMRAIKHSDISVSMPMITFTPLFMLITSPIMIGQFPKPLGYAGIACIVLGAYVLNVSQRHISLFAPIKALYTNKGARLMLMVAFIWSITANIDKVGVSATTPVFWATSVYTAIAVILTPIMLIKSSYKKTIIKQLPKLIPLGFFASVALVLQMIAITLVIVPYVIAVKRLSAVFGVLFGGLLFKEQNIAERLIGVIIMVIGVALIAVS